MMTSPVRTRLLASLLNHPLTYQVSKIEFKDPVWRQSSQIQTILISQIQILNSRSKPTAFHLL
jgi:hypothetical protein